MKTKLDENFIKQHTLMECLRAFDGANGDTEDQKIKSLEVPFEALAKKMIYGGYFEVSNNGNILYRIYIHTVEFYYHEEGNGDLKIRDWIVYHRNPINGNEDKPLFEIGTLHSHVSGIDITFEGEHEDHYKYRGSALIRKFMVKEGNCEQFKEFPKPKDKTHPEIEEYPTHLYEYLFMKAPLSDIRVQWKEPESNKVPIQFPDVLSDVRFNVCNYKFENMRLEKLKGTQDKRKWSYARKE